MTGGAAARDFRALTAADVPSLDASKISSGSLSDSRLSVNVPLLSNGKLSDSELSANVALLNTSPTFTGTLTANSFTGSGAGLPSVPGTLPWHNVTGPSQTADPNNGYIANSSGQVTITLPGSSSVGDVVRVSGAGSGGWKVLSEARAGTVWSAKFDQIRDWRSEASSANGTTLVAVAWDGPLVVSTDSGKTWNSPHPLAARGCGPPLLLQTMARRW